MRSKCWHNVGINVNSSQEIIIRMKIQTIPRDHRLVGQTSKKSPTGARLVAQGHTSSFPMSVPDVHHLPSPCTRSWMNPNSILEIKLQFTPDLKKCSILIPFGFDAAHTKSPTVALLRASVPAVHQSLGPSTSPSSLNSIWMKSSCVSVQISTKVAFSSPWQ